MPFLEAAGKKVLFIHIPRTGGTSTEEWLRRMAPLRFFTFGVPSFLKCTPQHLTYSDIQAIFGDAYFDYAFTIVRNPYRRLESEYKMRHVLAKQGFFGGMEPFPAWLEATLWEARGNPWHLDNHVRPQWQFSSKHLKVFKFEEGLANIWKAVASDLGAVASDTPVQAQLDTKIFDGIINWDTKEVNMVRDFYRQDFEEFDFDIFSYDEA